MKFYTDKIKKQINDDSVTIVAATKYFNSTEMRDLYTSGISHFGENRTESLNEKYDQLQDLDITWHFIGTLQTKKVKKVVHQIDYLHSLNTVKLAQELNKRRTSPLKCFIQVNISNEESKHGFNLDEVIPFINEIKDLENIKLIGLMGMAEFIKDETIVSNEFQKLNTLQNKIKEELNIELKELSIGMSNDYLIALKHNATYLRLGSVLFKEEVN
jgi:pyridoxal phosphate enzyme (YggS family)